MLALTIVVETTVERAADDASELAESVTVLTDTDADADELSEEEETVSLFWRRIFSLETGYLHQIAFSDTGFVAMRAG